MRGSPYFSFWIPVTLAKIFFFPIVVTFAKIHLYEEETVLKHMHKKKEQVHRFSCALYAHAYAYVAGFLTSSYVRFCLCLCPSENQGFFSANLKNNLLFYQKNLSLRFVFLEIC